MIPSKVDFRLVCTNCERLRIVLDFPADAPLSTPISCSQCSAPRGTLGALRRLAQSDRRDLFEEWTEHAVGL